MAVRKTTTFDPADTAKKIWLAGLGALAVAEEEGGKLFSTLVAKGKKSSDWADLPERTVTGARTKLRTTASRLEEGLDEKVQTVLQRIGVPTRDEIVTLSRRVEALTKTLGGKRARKTTRSKRETKPVVEA